VGGVENYAYNLSTELVKLGHEVTVVCANEPKVKPKEMMEGIKVKRVNYIGKIANTNITLKLPLELFREDFDLVHTHIPTPWSADWSAIVCIASSIAKCYNRTSLKLVLKRANRIIITQPGYLESSPYLKKYKHKIEVIPNGVDAGKFKPIKVDKSANNLLFFLSLLDEFHRYKGLNYLLRALKIVKKEIHDVKLIIGGEGELMSEYQHMANSVCLNGDVEFHGFIPDENIVEYYNKCNAFVLPSASTTQEGFGIVLLEALACGTPVISTEIVGVAEDVKKNNAGVIVPPKDSKALADAIIYILKNEDLAKKMGENGRRLVEERYTWKGVAEQTEDVYEDLL
jgi:glycosyltransferase involved in cell wall biosynthesis